MTHKFENLENLITFKFRLLFHKYLLRFPLQPIARILGISHALEQNRIEQLAAEFVAPCACIFVLLKVAQRRRHRICRGRCQVFIAIFFKF